MKMFILLSSFFICTASMSQSAIEIKYNRTPLSLTPQNAALTPLLIYTIGMLMIFNDSFALVNFEHHWPVRKRNKKIIGDKLIHHATFFDFNSGERFQEVIWQEGKKHKYVIRDTSIEWNWQFFDDEKEIIGKKCKSALMVNKDNDSTLVWYSTEIRFSKGPLYYDNIPGVVLESFDQVRNAHIYAIEINDRNLTIVRPTEGVLVSLSEWRKIHAKLSSRE